VHTRFLDVRARASDGWFVRRALPARVVLPAENRFHTGAAYTTDKSGKDLVECISEVLTANLEVKLRASPYVAFQLDESSSIAREQFMIVYVSFVEHYTRHTVFFGLFPVKGTSSATLVAALYQALSIRDIPIAKFMCAGMDGCSAMMGCNQGVSVQWKSKVSIWLCVLYAVLYLHALSKWGGGACTVQWLSGGDPLR
jgi:hypothetical protein